MGSIALAGWGLKFLSTPSARRATGWIQQVPENNQISIHAHREEGDYQGSTYQVCQGKFLSTPSARRATFCYSNSPTAVGISIHALREEGDHWYTILEPRSHNFYPRPPRGGRPRMAIKYLHSRDFYPRPPRGGRQQKQRKNLCFCSIITQTEQNAKCCRGKETRQHPHCAGNGCFFRCEGRGERMCACPSHGENSKDQGLALRKAGVKADVLHLRFVILPQLIEPQAVQCRVDQR